MKMRVLLSILALGMVAGFMSAAPSAEAQTGDPSIALSFYVDPDGTGFVLSDTDYRRVRVGSARDDRLGPEHQGHPRRHAGRAHGR